MRVADAHPGAERTPADVEPLLGPAVDLSRRPRREPRLGRRHLAASRRAGEHPREDPVPGPRDRGPGDRRPLLVRLSALAAARPRGGGGGRLHPRPRVPGGRWARLAVSRRLRARPGLAGDPGSRQARHLLLARARAAGRGGSAARDAGRCRSEAVQVGRGDRDRRAPGGRGRGRRKGASLRPVRQPGPAQGAARAALRGLGCRATAPPAGRASDRQPPLPAVVDRRLPGDRQRALEPQSGLHGAPDRARASRFPTGARSRSCRGSA